MQRQTTTGRTEDQIQNWYLIDANGLTLGRMSTQIATLLRGKHKHTYTPHIDGGDQVIVINAEKIVLTGNKLEDKKYYNYSGHPGGLRVRNAKTMVDLYPEELVRRSIWGMLPHTKMGRKQMKHLYVYSGPSHEHKAQNPKVFEIK